MAKNPSGSEADPVTSGLEKKKPPKLLTVDRKKCDGQQVRARALENELERTINQDQGKDTVERELRQRASDVRAVESIVGSEDGVAQASAVVGSLEALWNEHKQPANQSDVYWKAARPKYVAMKNRLIGLLAQMKVRKYWIDDDLATDIDTYESLVRTTFETKEVEIDIGGGRKQRTQEDGHFSPPEKMDGLIGQGKALVLILKTRTKEFAREKREERDAKLAEGQIPPRKYEEILGDLRDVLSEIVDQNFWQSDDYKGRLTRSISASAEEILKNVNRVNPIVGERRGTINKTPLGEVLPALKELTTAMRSQLNRDKDKWLRTHIKRWVRSHIIATILGLGTTSVLAGGGYAAYRYFSGPNAGPPPADAPSDPGQAPAPGENPPARPPGVGANPSPQQPTTPYIDTDYEPTEKPKPPTGTY